MKIVFDLDGVLRDLVGYIINKTNIPYPTHWDWRIENKDIFEWVKESDYKALIEAPETKYCSLIKTYMDNIEIWTQQPLDWRDKTLHWINKHFGNCMVRFLSTQEKQTRLEFLTDTLLVEDSPNFTNYNRVILIDHPYNKNIEVSHRIEKPEDLLEVFKLIGSEQHNA